MDQKGHKPSSHLIMTSNFIIVTIKFSIIDPFCKFVIWTFHNVLLIFVIFTAHAHKNFEIVTIESVMQYTDSVLLIEILWYKAKFWHGLQIGAVGITRRGSF